MKSKIIPLILAGACLNLARADFNPVTLTSNSYTYDIVVEKTAPGPMPWVITASVGGGTGKGDSTFFERGVYDRATNGSYCGVPPHGSVFTDQSNANRQYIMPSDYTVNNGLLIDSAVTSGTLSLSTPTTATSISILGTGGASGAQVNYTVNHQDGITTETGSFNPGDWFGGSNPAWICGGRINTPGGGFSAIDMNGTVAGGSSGANPRMYSKTITVSSVSPVTSVSFSYVSGGGHDCFFAISAATGTTYAPVTIGGFNQVLIFPYTFPVTATMDNGTVLTNNGGNNTWFEQGYDTNAPTVGLPPSGTQFNSLAQPTHHYQMGDYTKNNAILIDTNHLIANVTPSAQANYTAFAFLTAGAHNGTPMQNTAILQHADGVQETNTFLGYDWFANNPNALAFKANGRMQMYDRTLNNISNNTPYLFETYFTLTDITSPVTNIVVKYKSAAGASSTTYIMAVSASTDPIAPVITSGPVPSAQAWYPGQSATYTVTVAGSQPVTNGWYVQQGGAYVPMTDGVDANGSTITGSGTTSLTISGITVADATNYEFVAANSVGSVTSSPAALFIKGRAGVVPISNWNNIYNQTLGLGNGTNIYASDGTTTAYMALQDNGATNGWNSGITGDGSSSSLMNGFMDANANSSGDGVVQILSLPDPTYDVYLYALADTTRPSSATDGLPNYTVADVTYYAPILGATGSSTYDLTSAIVGGNGFNGFVPATTSTTNDFNKDIPAANFGNYIKIPSVSASGGEIDVKASFDVSSFRSPLNGIELVSKTTGKHFGIHFMGRATDIIAPGSPLIPVIDSQIPAGNTTLNILTNKLITTTYSVTVNAASATPLSYQWLYSGTPIPGATNASYTTIDTNGAVYTVVVTNFAGSATSAPVTIAMYNRPTLTAYQSAVLGFNPVAYWPLTETSGNVAFDYASTNDGTYTGTYTLGNPGIPATAGIGANTSVGFDGSTAYVDIPVNNLNITGPITVMQWVQPTAGDTGFRTTLGHTDSGYRFDVDPKAHWADAGPDIVDTVSINDGNWHLLVGVYDGTNETLYVDQRLVGSHTASPSGSTAHVWIGGAPDYPGARNFKGNSCQVAIFATALSATQVGTIYNALGNPPTVAIAPTTPSIYAGSSLTLTATTTGSTPIALQWYTIDNNSVSNNILHATNATLTVPNVPVTQNGYTYGVRAVNAYGVANASVPLVVQNGPAFQITDISPLTAEAYAGAPITYSVGAGGTAPIYYQWLVDSAPVVGATNSSFTMAALCGSHTIQVTYTNAQSAGSPVISSLATVVGDANPTNITFNTDGTGWTVTGTVGSIVNGLLTLTDGNGSEATSAYYDVPQYVGSFSASFTYFANGGADGAAFVIQNSPSGAAALGGGGGALGYNGVTNSLAFELNLYNSPGIAFATQGDTGNYSTPGNVNITLGDPIQVQVSFNNGVMSVTLTDTNAGTAFTTNHVFGSVPAILGGANLAYVGFSGADGGIASTQTITNFMFHSLIPQLPLTVSPVVNGAVTISWPTSDPNYQLQVSSSLTSPSWTTGPTATIVNGVAQASVNVTGTGVRFYRLVHVACP